MTPDTAEELAQEWQHRLLNGEPLTKADHAAFIRTALLCEREKELEIAINAAQAVCNAEGEGECIVDAIRALKSILPDQEEKKWTP